MAYTAGAVCNRARILLNDSKGQLFKDPVLLPFLQTALEEMEELFQENGLSTTNKTTSDPITITAGTTEVGSAGNPSLPLDLVDIQSVYERASGSSDDFVPLTRMEFLPTFLTTPINMLTIWAWQGQVIRMLEANSDREIKIDYISTIFPEIHGPGDVISILSAKTALAYRTAGLAASNVGENPTRADELNNSAGAAAERVIGIMIKSAQGIVTRRRPFRANYKNRFSSWA